MTAATYETTCGRNNVEAIACESVCALIWLSACMLMLRAEVVV